MPACVSLVRNGVGIPAYRPTPTRIMPRSISARPVLWNTIYVEAVLEQFRKEGYPVNEEDKARLSPPDPRAHQHAGAPFVRDAGGCGQRGTAPAAKPGSDERTPSRAQLILFWCHKSPASWKLKYPDWPAIACPTMT
jgi:hypothetical protein